MPVKMRNWPQAFDNTGDVPVQTQGEAPVLSRSSPIAAANNRTVLGADGFLYDLADLAVAPRGQKHIIWSSEGYTSLGNNLNNVPSGGFGPQGANVGTAPAAAVNGVAIPALSAAQKKATGAASTNIGTLLGATAPALDFSPYRSLDAVITLSGFAGGTSIQFELDMQDDAATPNSVAIWKPAALTTTQTMILVHVGLDQPFLQAAAAPNTVVGATGYQAEAALPSGVLFYPVYLPLLPQGNFQWTIVGTFTTLTWTAFLYGRY